VGGGFLHVAERQAAFIGANLLAVFRGALVWRYVLVGVGG
jgi:hypothetical protein